MSGQDFAVVELAVIGAILMGEYGMFIALFVGKPGTLIHAKNAPQKI